MDENVDQGANGSGENFDDDLARSMDKEFFDRVNAAAVVGEGDPGNAAEVPVNEPVSVPADDKGASEDDDLSKVIAEMTGASAPQTAPAKPVEGAPTADQARARDLERQNEFLERARRKAQSDTDHLADMNEKLSNALKMLLKDDQSKSSQASSGQLKDWSLMTDEGDETGEKKSVRDDSRQQVYKLLEDISKNTADKRKDSQLELETEQRDMIVSKYLGEARNEPIYKSTVLGNLFEMITKAATGTLEKTDINNLREAGVGSKDAKLFTTILEAGIVDYLKSGQFGEPISKFLKDFRGKVIEYNGYKKPSSSMPTSSTPVPISINRASKAARRTDNEMGEDVSNALFKKAEEKRGARH